MRLMNVMVLAMAGLIVGCEKPSSPEPTYSGKPLSEWSRLADDNNPTTSAAAFDALSHFPPAYTPQILAVLRAHPDSFEANHTIASLEKKGPAHDEAVGRMISALINGTKSISSLKQRAAMLSAERPMTPEIVAALEHVGAWDQTLKDYADSAKGMLELQQQYPSSPPTPASPAAH
jgi:hypothetical protein